ncbi:MAG: XRE family transcriptional regulator [Phycisphaerae bacterium]
MRLGDIIRARRTEMGKTQDQVSEQAGISKPYLSNIETGKAKNPPTDGVLEALESALQLDAGQLTRIAHLARTPPDVREEHQMLEQRLEKITSALRKIMEDRGQQVDHEEISALLEGDEDLSGRISPGGEVPVINNLAAGYPQDFTDLDYPPGVADEYVRCPGVADPQAFAARVVGDSMEPKYREGDIVVFSPNASVHNGQDCFIRFEGGGTTFKRMYQDSDQVVRLQPLNPRYAARTYATEEITGLWPAVLRIEKLGA